MHTYTASLGRDHTDIELFKLLVIPLYLSLYRFATTMYPFKVIPTVEVWKMIFLFSWAIFRFHVNFQACTVVFMFVPSLLAIFLKDLFAFRLIFYNVPFHTLTSTTSGKHSWPPPTKENSPIRFGDVNWITSPTPTPKKWTLKHHLQGPGPC